MALSACDLISSQAAAGCLGCVGTCLCKHRLSLSSPPPSCLVSQLPEVFSSGHEIPEFLQTQPGEDSVNWSQIKEGLWNMKISLQLRGEDGSVWNYKPPANSDGKEIIPLLPHLADMSTYMFKGIINFAKVISYFR